MTRRDGARESMRRSANRTRDVADEMALMFGGCDDPLHPFGPQAFHDWIDFTDSVARPLVEADGDEQAVQTAMALYRTVNPYYICVSLVMASNRIESLTAERDELVTRLPQSKETLSPTSSATQQDYCVASPLRRLGVTK